MKQSLTTALESQYLAQYANTCRWFAGKARPQTGFKILNSIDFLLTDGTNAWLLVIEASYVDGPAEQYLLPVSLVEVVTEYPEKATIIAQTDDNLTLIDAIYDERFRTKLFQNTVQSASFVSQESTLTFAKGRGLTETDAAQTISSRVLNVDSSNSAMIFGEKYFMKLYRKLFAETNPEVEMVAFLTEHGHFENIPAFGGSITWQRTGQPDVTLGMMQSIVKSDCDSWVQTGDYLNDFMKAVPQRLFAVSETVFEQVALLGQRTGEMHLSLYAPNANAAFCSEPFTLDYRQFLHKRFTHLLDIRYNLLIENYAKLDVPTQRLAWIFMEARELIDDFAAEILTKPLESKRIRIHGDYHLGQVLSQNDDYIIIDFEGEPEATITERKIKHSPLKDVAGMIRSYHYAVSAKLFNADETKTIDPEKLLTVTDRWYKLMRDTYLDAYFGAIGSPHPLFKSQVEVNFLLLYFLLEKAVYELGYEISYRPDWVKIPLRGIVEVIREVEKLRESPVSLTALGSQTGVVKNK
jgi:maltose alpha-D-glucosyltransferase/alpha-amylase